MRVAMAVLLKARTNPNNIACAAGQSRNRANTNTRPTLARICKSVLKTAIRQARRKLRNDNSMPTN
jgi:hypothetical protein